MREVYKSVAPKRDYLYFNEMENVIAEIGERYGRFQDVECRQIGTLRISSRYNTGRRSLALVSSQADVEFYDVSCSLGVVKTSQFRLKSEPPA